ncbi:uncharacterized protein UV8b_03306 [Ustilaginoidea virens]|uniref:WSC domain-containing protein n=1 Tax=Ustilaginoidea virens TaxID=1159556 RepID=A0A8E5HPM2_USTVR|nr:uncharacterized protein UV8b_03306 [Ustilaginoidea virens]QUC19065.1 hypothetical protein UV8b_03306 [Ustilaginoidea virens]
MGWATRRLLVLLKVQALWAGGTRGDDVCSGDVIVNLLPLQTGAYVTVTQPLPGTATAGTTITIPPSGTVLGSVIIQTPTTTSPSQGCDLPNTLPGFQLYGCAISAAGFPGFVKISTDKAMDLGKCAAMCTTRFIGVYNRQVVNIVRTQ